MDYKPRVNIDLHVHSNSSDGSLSPVEIVALADQLNLGALSITDHDTLDGARMAKAAGTPDGLRFLTGVEISAARPDVLPGGGSFHLLGYGIDLDDPDLNRILEQLQSARKQRNPRIVQRLNDLGVDIGIDEIQAGIGEDGQMGRPHIAVALVERGIVKSVNEAFDRYLGTGQPAYVDKFRVSCAQAIETISAAGGIPVLAHPGLLGVHSDTVLEDLFQDLKNQGLKGVEAYYPEHGVDETRRYLELCRKHNLVATGGTDFHGAIKPEIQVGIGGGDFHVPFEVYENLIACLNTSEKPVVAPAFSDKG